MVDFLAGAQHYVDQLDPLCSTPHDADFEAARAGYYSPIDKKVNETLDRLLGNHWSDAFKVGQPASEPEPSETSILFGGRSEKGPKVRPDAQ
jgi:hypothetical protein